MAAAVVKALPLWQPYASLVAMGVKRVETRHFPPSRLGLEAGQRIAIYATLGTGPGGKAAYLAKLAELRHLLAAPPRFEGGLHAAQVLRLADELPRGKVIATATLASAEQMTPQALVYAWRHYPTEVVCGDWKVGRWAWQLTDVRTFDPFAPPPLPVVNGRRRGSRQGAFNIGDDVPEGVDPPLYVPPLRIP